MLVDGWTPVGGSQWIDSEHRRVRHVSARGRRRRSSRTPIRRAGCAGCRESRRAATARSSMRSSARISSTPSPRTLPMALFEVTVAHELPRCRARAARSATRRSARRLRESTRSARPATCCWSRSARSRTRSRDGALPFRVDTAALVPDVWERWLARDPVRLVAAQPDAAQALRGVWLDAGRGDEYFLDLGAVALRDALLAAGLAEDALHFELFDGGHRGVSGRYPLRSPGSSNVSARRQSLHHLDARRVEAELAVERVHVGRVQEPRGRRAGRARPSRARAPRRGRGRGAPRARRRRRGRRTTRRRSPPGRSRSAALRGRARRRARPRRSGASCVSYARPAAQ